jgi:hypothetical protein
MDNHSKSDRHHRLMLTGGNGLLSAGQSLLMTGSYRRQLILIESEPLFRHTLTD